ncbi:hypothetical protein HC776_01410 [bacterium]|nr:hypothetical protein [bacterium]
MTEYRATFEKDTAGAKKLISIGESKPDAKLDTTRLAAMTMIANTLLNLDETITKE